MEETTGPSLTLNTIKNIVVLIDLMADSGKFQSWETIKQVYSLRTAFTNFLESLPQEGEEPTEGEEARKAEQISVVSLRDALTVVNYGAEQGAYRGWETFQQAFAIRNELADFLTYVDSVTPKPAETDEGAAAESALFDSITGEG